MEAGGESFVSIRTMSNRTETYGLFGFWKAFTELVA